MTRLMFTLLLILMVSFVSVSAQTNTWVGDLQAIAPENAARLRPLAIFYDFNTPLFSPDGAYLAMLGINNTLSLFETATGINRTYIATGQFVFSPDSSLLVYGDGSETMRVLDIASGDVRELIPSSSYPYIIHYEVEAVSPDNTKLLVSRDGQYEHERILAMLDLETGEVLLPNAGILDPHFSPVFSPDSTLYAVYASSRELYISRVDSGEKVIEIPARTSLLKRDLVFYEDGTVTANNEDRDNGIILINTHDFTTRIIPVIGCCGDNDVLYYDSTTMFSINRGGQTKTIHQFDVPTGNEVSTFMLNPSPDGNVINRHMGWVELNASGTVLAGTEYLVRETEPRRYTDFHTLWLWNARTGDALLSYPLNPRDALSTTSFSADNRILLTTDYAGYSIVLWGIPETPYQFPLIYGNPPANSSPEYIPTWLICAEAPASRLNTHEYAVVTTAVETGTNRNLIVRSTPGGEQIGSLQPGERVYLADGPVCGEDGLMWWGVQSIDGSNLQGWSIEGFAPDDYLLLPDTD